MHLGKYNYIIKKRYDSGKQEGDCMMEIIRQEYLDKLLDWKDKNVIKVVTGMRRCGKSTLLEQYANYLISHGVDESRIIRINFEKMEYEELLDYRKLNEYITGQLNQDEMTYIFLDEVQKVTEYEKAVDSLYVADYTDLYITGSNAYMLSGDLATYLSGRYVEISMLPFSFKEYSVMTGMQGEEAFSSYLKTGGLPFITGIIGESEQIDTYLEGIYHTVLIKDIEQRQSRNETDPNKRKVTDIVLLKNIARYLASTSASLISVSNVSGYITSLGRKVSPNTISDYMDALSQAFIFYQVNRFDVDGKELLKGNGKWYIVDLGLRRYILPKSSYDLGCSIENVVYFELRRRGYRVNVGKLDDVEVAFVARKNDEIIYYQVTADMTSADVFKREMRSLQMIRDNYEKVVLTLDRYSLGNYEGIRVVNVVDWLMKENSRC